MFLPALPLRAADTADVMDGRVATSKDAAADDSRTGTEDLCADAAGMMTPRSPHALWPPVQTLVTSPFGERRGDSVGSARGRCHNGLDIRARIGWPILSLGDGVVDLAGNRGRAGLMVRVRQDNGRQVAYAHMSEILVKNGERVRRGQYVGRVGCTGYTTGAHLHITVRDASGRYIDPSGEFKGLWELFDPPPEELAAGPIDPMACPMKERVKGSPNKRLIGSQQYLRMREALSGVEKYKVMDGLD